MKELFQSLKKDEIHGVAIVGGFAVVLLAIILIPWGIA